MVRAYLRVTANPYSLRNQFDYFHETPGARIFEHAVMTNHTLYALAQSAATIFTAECGGCGGAVFSAYFTYQMTGSVSGAVRAGAVVLATNYAYDAVGGQWKAGTAANVIAHGVVGGTMNVLSGGSFRSGLLGGVAGSWASTWIGGHVGGGDFGQAMAAGLVGGLAAAAGGGRFGDGFIQGAAGYAFNFLRHAVEATSYIEQLRKGSPLAAEILDAMAADKSTTYYISVGRVPYTCGGGCTEVVAGPQPSFLARLFGETNDQVTVVMRIDPATAEPLRALAHELGHGYTYLKEGPIGNYDKAIEYENIIARQLNPNAPIRSVSDHGRWYQ